MAPNMLPKWYQKSIKKMIDFWIGFWELPGGLVTFDRAAGPANWGVPPPPKLLAKAKSDLKSSDMKIEDMKI